MTQLVLPNSIDASTEIVASEHQQNYVAIRDIINGDLEGGSGSDGNIKALGITAREIEANVLRYGGANPVLQPGVYAAGDFKVTPGAGLNLNFATGRGFINDDASIHSLNTLIPAAASSGSLVIAANASGNPRIDQIVLTLTGYDTGTLSVVQGTAAGGATLDNRTGAAALPAKSIRIADILMPNAFAGPFVQATHIRDRRPWARGAYLTSARSDGDSVLSSTTYAVLSNQPRLEVSGSWPVEISTVIGVSTTSAAIHQTYAVPVVDGATPSGIPEVYGYTPTAAGVAMHFGPTWTLAAAAGSHTFGLAMKVSAGSSTVNRNATNPLVIIVRELVGATNTENSGA